MESFYRGFSPKDIAISPHTKGETDGLEVNIVHSNDTETSVLLEPGKPIYPGLFFLNREAPSLLPEVADALRQYGEEEAISSQQERLVARTVNKLTEFAHGKGTPQT